MKSLTTYIAEKMIFNKSTATNYNYHPKSKAELQKIIIDRIKEEGNELDLNDIDTSALTDLSHLFDNTISELFADFNGNISKWDVSNVTDIKYCFGFCKKFNGDLSGWNLSEAEDISFMFKNCYEFQGKGLENWNISKAETARGMFMNCKKFNSNISKWDPKNINDSCYMFDGCSHFNQDLSNWNMQSIYREVDYEDMFYACPLENNKQKQPKFNI